MSTMPVESQVQERTLLPEGMFVALSRAGFDATGDAAKHVNHLNLPPTSVAPDEPRRPAVIANRHYPFSQR